MRFSSTSTAMSRGAEPMFSENWSPPWRQTDRTGAFVIASLASTISTVLELPPGADRLRTRTWLGGWLKAWLVQASEADRSQPATFLYVVLRSTPIEGDPYGMAKDRPVAEFGIGTEPCSPDTWVEKTAEELILTAVDDLSTEP